MCLQVARVIGIGLFLRRTMAQQHLIGAVVASVSVHVVLLSLLLLGSRHRPQADVAPAVFGVKLWMHAPLLKPPSPVIPITSAEPATAHKSYERSAVRQPHVSVADLPSDVATSADTQNREPIDLPPASAQTNFHADRPLDLSPQAIIQAKRHNANPSLAQAVREQLGIKPVNADVKLGQHIASGAVPDCLHNAPDGEVKSSQGGLGGLLALPFVAYAAMTGKCK